MQSKEQLRQYVDRIERLESERDAITEDRKEVYNEADAHGFDKKILRKVVKLRKQDREKRLEEQELTQLYMEAVGE